MHRVSVSDYDACRRKCTYVVQCFSNPPDFFVLRPQWDSFYSGTLSRLNPPSRNRILFLVQLVGMKAKRRGLWKKQTQIVGPTKREMIKPKHRWSTASISLENHHWSLLDNRLSERKVLPSPGKEDTRAARAGANAVP